MRLLHKSGTVVSLAELGFEEEAQAIFRKALKRPYGMVLISGPTGSGKSTTLYAGMGELDRVGRNITTLEDPVEYHLDRVNQVNVNRKAGMTFSSGLRSILRQDPDIIMIGEMRDMETAELAIRSALTGHLVLSTVHANDAPATATQTRRHRHRAVPGHERGASRHGAAAREDGRAPTARSRTSPTRRP